MEHLIPLPFTDTHVTNEESICTNLSPAVVGDMSHNEPFETVAEYTWPKYDISSSHEISNTFSIYLAALGKGMSLNS